MCEITQEWAIAYGFELCEDLGDQIYYIHPCFPELILDFDHDIVVVDKIIKVLDNGDLLYETLLYDAKTIQELEEVFAPYFYS